MMKISVKTEYALRALLDLSRHSTTQQVVPLGMISKRQDIPENYLEHIMLQLKKADFVDSRRGIGGGFYLAKNPSRMTVGDIIRLIDGPIENKLVKSKAHGQPAEQQAFQEIWTNVSHAISNVVDHVTFADLLRRTEELYQKQEFNYVI